MPGNPLALTDLTNLPPAFCGITPAPGPLGLLVLLKGF